MFEELDEASLLKNDILRRLREELYPDMLRVLELRQQTVHREIYKLDQLRAKMQVDLEMSHARFNGLISEN